MLRCILPCLLAAACGGGGGGTAVVLFGLEGREVVQGLTFPASQPPLTQADAEVAFPRLRFTAPVFLTYPPDGTNRVFVVEQGGTIRVFPNDPDANATTEFLRISVVGGGERGLLGLAFHPDYATNGYFYVYHSAPAQAGGDHDSVVARYQVSADPDVTDSGSREELLRWRQPFGNHNAGMIAFGPDNKLYIASGDGGSGGDPQGNAQDLTNLLGKILRVEPDGSIPNDNPFVGTPGARGEIWAYGLRNPWRFSFDRETGRLWCGDVGQSVIEEISIIERGGNYGWRKWEGNRLFNAGDPPIPNHTPPVVDYDHSLGAAVTGGYVYRGARLPSLRGLYVYADYVSGRIWALEYDGTQATSNVEIADLGVNISSFGEDEAGELYFTAFDGRIYQLVDNSAPPAGFPQTLSATGLFSNTSALVPTEGLIEYEVNAPLWSDGARKRRWIALPGIARIGFHPTGAWEFPEGTVLVKHFEIETAPGVVRRLETRVLVLEEEGWAGYTYRWNAAQTDADLITDAETDVFTVEDPGAPGGQRQQTWYFPSRSDCMSCHTTAAGRILGVRTRQLNRDFDYPRLTDNQLRAWNHIGLFSTDIGDETAYEALPDPADESAPLAQRARGYLAANCGNCHLPLGPTPTNIDLRYHVPTNQTNTVGTAATNPVDGVPGAQRITTGLKEGSDLWERLRRTDEYRMPPLSSNVPDPAGIDLVGRWIDAGPD